MLQFETKSRGGLLCIKKFLITTLVCFSSVWLILSKNEPAVRFTDVLQDSGIGFKHHFFRSEQGEDYHMNQYDHGSGVLVADVNGDGLMDIYLLDFLGPNALYVNRGKFKFEDVAKNSGVDMPEDVSVGGSFGDYDNDGDEDLYVTTYHTGNRLFRNRGDGTFEDVTKIAGVGHVGHSSTALWFDFDVDGNLDLYVTDVGTFHYRRAESGCALRPPRSEPAFKLYYEQSRSGPWRRTGPSL